MKWLLTYLVVLCASAIYGQEYIINLKHWDMKDGLSHRQVNNILVDKQGMLWLCTKNGLNRFDGYTFKVYNQETHSLPFNNTERAVEYGGQLWVMGEGHNEENLVVFDPVTNTSVSARQKTGANEKIHIDFIGKMNNGTLIFGDAATHTFYTWQKGEPLRKNVLAARDRLARQLFTNNALLMVTRAHEIYKIDVNNKELKRIEVPFVPDAFHAEVSGEGTYITDSATQHVYYLSPDLEITDVHSSIPALDRSIQDNIFNTGTDKIIWRQGRLYKNGTILRDFIGEGMAELRNRLRDIKVDELGHIWLANDFGIFMLSITKSKFTRYFYQDPKVYNHNSYRGILADNSCLYACNEFTGIKKARIDNGSCNKLSAFNMPSTSIGFFGLTKTQDDRLLSVNYEFVFTIDKNGTHPELYHLPLEMGKKYYWKTVEVAPDSFLLCSSFGLHWLNLKTKKFSAFTGMNKFTELSNTIVLDMVPGEQGKSWLCTNNGLYEYDPAKGITNRYSSADRGANYLPAREIQHCFKDSGVYWLATTSGLVKWNKQTGQYRLFGRRDGLNNENLYAVYDDRQGRLWLSSDYGLMCFNKETHKVKTYLTSSGITHNEFNRASHFMDSNGRLYFGSLNGITAFDPKDFLRSETDKGATIAVTSYQQFDGETNRLEDKTPLLLATKQISLNPEDLFFTISFALLNYEDVEQNTYYWKIEGVDTGWTSMRDHVLRLSRLPYGEKVLRIKAQSGDGVWSQNELRFKLTVIKPFYLRSWFIVLCALAIATLFAALYLVRVKRLQRENIKLDKIVKEKTAGLEHTIRDLKESFEQKDMLMKEIHHRVKNNLQVITVLLKLQLANVGGEARRSIEESISRVNSIALIHQYLYKTADLTTINLATYVTELCQQIEAVYRKHGEGLTLINKIPPLHLDIDTAIPLGIILNELMVNSNKYAFNDRPTGTISIELEKYVSHYTLIYGDDGPGLPDNYSIGRANSLGMTIVKSLATQLKGDVVYKSSENRFYITFKDTPMRKNIA